MKMKPVYALMFAVLVGAVVAVFLLVDRKAPPSQLLTIGDVQAVHAELRVGEGSGAVPIDPYPYLTGSSVTLTKT